jgi:hypothetical protein
MLSMRCDSNWLNLAIEDTKLNPQGQLMTLDRFISITWFKVDKFAMDTFYRNIHDDLPIYLDDDIVRWFGYKGKLNTQKTAIKNLLINNFAEYRNIGWFEYSNKNYTKFYEKNPTYPDPYTFYGKNKTKHLIIHPHIFKCIILLSNTVKKMRIIEHYVALEDLVIKYTKYQCSYYKLNYNEEHNKLINLTHIKKYTAQQTLKYFDLQIQEKYRVGCVYFIQEDITKNIKIGWCWNLPNRISKLQTANSQQLSVVKNILTQFPYKKEQYLHKKYKDFHIRGEWFSCQVLV